MGRINDVMLDYLKDNARFADLFNGCCFQGQKVVKVPDLAEGSEIYVEYGQKLPQRKKQGSALWKKDDMSDHSASADAPRKSVKRERDIKKILKSGMTLRILGVENQEHVDYTMPWRVMGYDYHEYGEQVRERRRKNKSAGVLSTDAQYLCGLQREDRLAPCYTICLYHGEEPWDGPRNLKDMMQFEEGNSHWKELFSDYRMNLVCLNEMEDFSCFHSPLRELLELIPYRRDKKALIGFLESHPAYQTLDEETAEAAGELVGLKNFIEGKEKYEEGGTYNMCTAVRELIEDSKSEGRKEGEASFSSLTLKLISAGRIADLERAAKDGSFRKRLYRELEIYRE